MKTEIILKKVSSDEDDVKLPQNLVPNVESLRDNETRLITIGIKTITSEKTYGNFMYFPVSQIPALIEKLKQYG